MIDMRPKKFNEETRILTKRVPASAYDYLNKLLDAELVKYESVGQVTKYAEVELKVVPVKTKWQIDAEERMKRNK
jgi:hypothetical protein